MTIYRSDKEVERRVKLNLTKALFDYAYYMETLGAEEIIKDILEPLHLRLNKHNKSFYVMDATNKAIEQGLNKHTYKEGYLLGLAQAFDDYKRLEDFYRDKHDNRIKELMELDHCIMDRDTDDDQSLLSDYVKLYEEQ